jgi:hypothetical protein
VVGTPDATTDFSQTGGHPVATYTVLGTLPFGIGIGSTGPGTASIAGTAPDGSGGTYPVTVVGSNGVPPDATHPFTLTVHEASELTGPASAAFTVGTPGSSTAYTATGFPVPTITAPNGLPGGLTLAGGSGTATISGTPADNSGGSYPDVVVTASNGVGPDATVLTDITINEAPELAGPASVRFVTGTGGSHLYSTTGFPLAELAVDGALPPGVSFTDNGDGTGTLSAPASVSAVGTYTVTIVATNGIGDDAELPVTIQIVPPVSITTTTLPNGSFGTGYSAFVQATGGVPPYRFAVVGGSLPSGLSLDPDTGAITGTPNGAIGTSNFVVEVRDSLDPAQTDTEALSITIGKGQTTLTVEPVLLDARRIPGIQLNLVFVRARLTNTSTGAPIPGETIVFTAGGSPVCTAATGLDGRAACALNLGTLLLVVLNGGVKATYSETAVWQGSTGSAGLLAI